jgi:uncharacterized membrane protein YeaQ/YmgE (transglycosylase-associated protein family)
MTLATLLFAFTISTLYGAGFHLALGGGARRLALYLLAGWLGFVLGHWLGDAWGISAMRVGSLNLLAATLGSAVALGAAWLLARRDGTKNA